MRTSNQATKTSVFLDLLKLCEVSGVITRLQVVRLAINISELDQRDPEEQPKATVQYAKEFK